MPETEAPNADSWDDIADWWRSEVAADVVYHTDVFPVFDDLTAHMSGSVVDLGCGNGHAMGRFGAQTVGVDLSQELLTDASVCGPVVRARLPSLAMFRGGVFDHAVSIYLIDLIGDDATLFAQTARVVRTGGTFAMVINHPVYTAPGSAPIADVDGEVLWRWGAYTSTGSTQEPGGGRTIRFHHRPMDTLMTHAATAGWSLRSMIERPMSREAVDALPGYEGQDAIPRLLGVLWENRARAGS